MATHFSANQYENAFAANRLQNYQVPRSYKKQPTARQGSTNIISNDRGHLLPNVPRSKESPWGNFKGTWDDHLNFCKVDEKTSSTANKLNDTTQQQSLPPPQKSMSKSEMLASKEVSFAEENPSIID